ncbi:MAG: capreomycidine synthase [Jatrophihabitans sp.]
MTMRKVMASELEDWLRDRYFEVAIDISSSGVADYRLGELLDRTSLTMAQLTELTFRDSPSLGCEALRAAVASRFGAADPNEVLITNGSTEALFLLLSAQLSAGDEVIVLDPVYPSLGRIPAALGARMVSWALRPERNFEPDLDELGELLHPGVRAVLVNFPHNPTGAHLTSRQLTRLLELTGQVGAMLIWDGAFSELVYDAQLVQPAAGSDPLVAVTGTVSKAYGLPGLRVGWCLAPPPVLAELVRIRDYVTLGTSALSELIATAALESGDALLAPRLRQAELNRSQLLDWAGEQPGRVELPVPRGGVCAFPRFPGLPETTDLCARLAEQHRTLVVPGSCFGHPDRIRLGFGGRPADLEAGLEILSRAVADEAAVAVR